MASPKKSLYDILGIGRDANAIDIGLAYDRRRAEAAKRVPPDANETALVQQAYEVLADEGQRAAYDASLVTAAERAAAVEQPTDLLLEPEPAPPPKKPLLVGAIAGTVVIAAALYFTFNANKSAPPKDAPPPPPKQVVQAPPPPPKPLGAEAILAGVAASVGQVLSYQMSGQARPIGLAVAIDRGVFVTTCHGIPAGSALVVRIGRESHSATLAATDEQLDLCKLAVPEVRTGGLAPVVAELKQFDKVYVTGTNAKGEIALAESQVKQLRTTPLGKVIEVEVPIATGGSGGAVFDSFGRLVGIATTPHGFGAGLNVVLPAALFAEVRSRTRTP